MHDASKDRNGQYTVTFSLIAAETWLQATWQQQKKNKFSDSVLTDWYRRLVSRDAIIRRKHSNHVTSESPGTVLKNIRNKGRLKFTIDGRKRERFQCVIRI
eukprot:5654611-Pleurochrysis_carterae.AAC.5